MAIDTSISIEYLRQCLIYDPGSGILTWLRRPRAHFATARARAIWGGRFAGKPAGSLRQGEWVLTLTVDGKRHLLFARRVARALETGAWPPGYYRGQRRDNTSGATGVVPLPSGRWRAQIRVDGKLRHLGVFDTVAAAAAAYEAAKADLAACAQRDNPQERS